AADLIADAKKRPGELTYASSGIGGVPHLAAALFSNEAGIETRHIPFGAGSQAVADIINGQVTFLFYPYSALGGQIQDGVLRVLANSAPKRTSTVPDVPTVAELGFPDATIQSWQGVYAPSGTPPEIIEKLSKAVNQAVGDPAMVAKGENMGLEFGGNSAEELAAFTASEIERFKKILAIAGIEAK
ncbi:MAG: tripartite tricarboxylate transporter substrate binding protein, partial [Candidatus Competibacteraceae bacterium]|nr:tripartite tricarboxylate transporter substrate binding protein [Candidatus Competibacteraceae bacterium]